MQLTVNERNRVWVGTPRLERIMGIDHGIILLRSRNRKLLSRLVATALIKNYNPDARTAYLYATDDYLNPEGEFITKISQELGLDWNILMSTVHFINVSTASPMRLAEQWYRLEDSAPNAKLLVVDSIGHHAGRDAYLIQNVNTFCYHHGTLALVLDCSEELDPTLERLATVIVDLDVRGDGIEVFLKKHPKMPQTVFLMSP